jgi:hypothetical protein
MRRAGSHGQTRAERYRQWQRGDAERRTKGRERVPIHADDPIKAARSGPTGSTRS